MTYAEKLKDPRWQKKRLEILERDKHKCVQCNCKYNLHVHHLNYIKNTDPWDYDNNYLITLCDVCHSFEGKYRIELKNEILKAFDLNKIWSHELSAYVAFLEKYPDAFKLICKKIAEHEHVYV